MTLDDGRFRSTASPVLQELLSTAESRLQAEASQERGQGILATRIDPGHYVLTLSDRVPYGTTMEEFQ